MNKHQKGKRGEPRHVRLYHWLTDSPAWKDLNATARAIYVEIAKRYNGTNNGFIVYSVRQAADELKSARQPPHGLSGTSRRTALRRRTAWSISLEDRRYWFAPQAGERMAAH
jgi:hypothetical protein